MAGHFLANFARPDHGRPIPGQNPLIFLANSSRPGHGRPFRVRIPSFVLFILSLKVAMVKASLAVMRSQQLIFTSFDPVPSSFKEFVVYSLFALILTLQKLHSSLNAMKVQSSSFLSISLANMSLS